jgi:hypothetical protein
MRDASVEGDVYLLMQNGDTKRGAGLTINLLRVSEELQRQLDLTCAEFSVRNGELGAKEDALREEWIKDILNRSKDEAYRGARIARSDLAEFTLGLVANRIREAKGEQSDTGMNAHYSFANVQPGLYVLFGEWQIGANEYQWWVPVELKSGQKMKRDLNTSLEAKDKLYCGIK